MKKSQNWHRVSKEGEYVGMVQDTSTNNEVYRDLVLNDGVDTVDKVSF